MKKLIAYNELCEKNKLSNKLYIKEEGDRTISKVLFLAFFFMVSSGISIFFEVFDGNYQIIPILLFLMSGVTFKSPLMSSFYDKSPSISDLLLITVLITFQYFVITSIISFCLVRTFISLNIIESSSFEMYFFPSLWIISSIITLYNIIIFEKNYRAFNENSQTQIKKDKNKDLFFEKKEKIESLILSEIDTPEKAELHIILVKKLKLEYSEFYLKKLRQSFIEDLGFEKIEHYREHKLSLEVNDIDIENN